MSKRIVPLLIGLMLSACGTSSSVKVDYSGLWQVVDVASDPPRPISDATILVTYQRTSANLAHSTRYCYDSRLLKSDSDGRFHVPRGGPGDEILVAAHKPSFARPLGRPPVQSWKNLAILSSGTSRKERALHYRILSVIAACEGSAASAFLDGLLPEIERNAELPEELEVVEHIRASQRNR